MRQHISGDDEKPTPAPPRPGSDPDQPTKLDGPWTPKDSPFQIGIVNCLTVVYTVKKDQISRENRRLWIWIKEIK